MGYDALKDQKEAEEQAFQNEARGLHERIMKEHISLSKPSEKAILINMLGTEYSRRNFSWLKDLEQSISRRKRNPAAI